MSEKILIVDDDLDTLRLVGLMLQRQGYQISAATNGQQGLDKAFEEDPDLILLDVMMPDMDGYEVTRRLRQNPSTASTPILMFTAKTQLDDKVVGFEVGVNDYLTKPTHPSELQARVKALLARITEKKTATSSAKEGGQGYVIGVLAPRDMHLISQVANYETTLSSLSNIARFVLLDLGVGIQPFAQKILPDCNEVLIVLEGSPNTIIHTKALIDDIASMGVNKKNINVVLNNRIRSDTQLPSSQVQNKLDHEIISTLTPAPELFVQATRMQTPAILCQPDSLTTRQINKLVDYITEREALPR